MALNQHYQFEYDYEPLIFVRLLSTSSSLMTTTYAIIDTGASRSIFDLTLAEELSIDLSAAPTRYLQGIEGTPITARVAEVELWLLDEPEFSLVFPMYFVPNVYDSVGNLIGL